MRTFTHRLPGLYSTFADIDADVYYCRIREYRHIIAYMAARKVKAKFILGLASDLDILSIGKRWKHFYSSNVKDLRRCIERPYRDRESLSRSSSGKADRVIVQHSGQKDIPEKEEY
ncbi:MAG: hypothetical protein U5L72_06525 [Bacteroidales bacterium]|nr:hypothetical protein [Bacteroidales bacterium]